MSKLFATAGSRIFIGGAMAFDDTDLVAADFNAQAWVEIDGVTNLGSAGDTSELVTAGVINQARTRKLKGLRNAGAMAVVAALDYSDAGQLALIAAERQTGSYAFKVVFNDAPASGTPSERYFVGLVMSAAEQFDEANSVMSLNAAIEIDSNIVRVAASGVGSIPDNTVLPAITGTAETGELLTASTGTWTGSPTPAYTFRWFRNGESLVGATASTYTVVEADEGAKLRVQVTATNVNGTASALSAETATVTDGA